MNAIELLEERRKIFAKLAGEFPVLSPSVRIVGDFVSGKVLQTEKGPAIDLTGMDCLALGCLPESRQHLADSFLARDGACPASPVVMLMAECAMAERELGRWFFPDAAEPDSLLFFVGFDANESFLYGLGVGFAGGVLSSYRRDVARLGGRSVPTVFLQHRHFHYSGQAGIARAVLEQPESCFRFTYRDARHLEALLEKKIPRRRGRGDMIRIIATDSLVSTTGEVYDMETLLQIAARYDCLLYVDEAHAGGAVGAAGRGVTANCPSFAAHHGRVIVMATLIKAVCLIGGVVAFPDSGFKRFFEMTCPHRVFSATPSPYFAAAIVERIRLLKGKWGEGRRADLAEVVRYARGALRARGFDALGTHHLCALRSNPAVAQQVRNFLALRGFLVAVFEAPALPRGQSLLRFGLRADLTCEEVDRLVAALCDARDAFRFTELN